MTVKIDNNKCIRCCKEITTEYFEGVNGLLCEKCLKDLFIYYALKSYGLIKNKGVEA